MTSAINTGSADSIAVQKRFLLQETIKDVTAAVAHGILNHPVQATTSSSSTSTSASAVSGARYISATTRMQGATEAAGQLRKLIDEYETLALTTVAQDMNRMVAPEQLSSVKSGSGSAMQPLMAARANASHRVFAQECGLELTSDDYLLPENYLYAQKKSSANSQSDGSAGDHEEAAKRLQPLKKLLESVKALRACKGFKYEEELQARNRETATTANTAAYHLPVIARRLEEVIGESIERLRSTFARCRSSAPFVAQVAAWPGPFLRLLNEVLQTVSLETLCEDTREKLRRVRFDVEELQHEQEQAVTDGDMHRSEELYFQQTALLETMQPHFDKLEKTMEAYKLQNGSKSRAELKQLQQSFSATMRAAVGRENQIKRRATSDLEKLNDNKATIIKLREEQKAGMSMYKAEWAKLFESTVQQQQACFRAMEELERRLKQLASEQAFIVEDRVARITQERQREEDALTFYCFVESQQESLQFTMQNAEAAATSMQQLGQAVEFSFNHLDCFLRDCVEGEADAQLLETRKERLEQFRGLYLTLGDLQFKKSRHAEEIARKVEYYQLQQEIAMDALNPKAKEYSQARQKWQAVHDEVNAQLHAIESKCASQETSFRPTEQLLLEAGYQFKHPKVELEERNAVRAQKLLEYKQLMDSKVVKPSSSSAGGGDGALDKSLQEEADNNMLQLYSRRKGPLQAQEDSNNVEPTRSEKSSLLRRSHK